MIDEKQTGLTNIRVRAADGCEADLSISAPIAAEFGILWLPALGVAARNYQALASALAGEGIATALHEWRGARSSSVRASRNCDWGYRELIEFDIAASLAAAREACPSVRWVVAGHSIGGQFACLFGAMNPQKVEAIAFVASGSPYWRTFSGTSRWLLRLIPPLVGVVTFLWGYYPGKRLGFAGTEARTLMRDWSRSGRSGRYASYVEGVDFEAAMGRYAQPLLCVQLSEDRLCPSASSEWLLGKFSCAEIQRIELRPEDFPAGVASHFSWLKEPALVAQRIAVWLKQRSSRES